MKAAPNEAVAAALTAAATAGDAARQAASVHAARLCDLTALLVASLLPAAASMVFKQDEDTVSAETIITLVNIRDSNDALLWYDEWSAFAGHPDALALGKPPELNPGMLSDIGFQLRAAYDACPGHFDTASDGYDVMPDENLLVLPLQREEPPGITAIQLPGSPRLDADDEAITRAHRHLGGDLDAGLMPGIELGGVQMTAWREGGALQVDVFLEDADVAAWKLDDGCLDVHITMAGLTVHRDSRELPGACTRCGGSTGDGEGWDGLCGTCAARDYAAEQAAEVQRRTETETVIARD